MSSHSALLNHYVREGLPRHLYSTCVDMLRKKPGDPILLFWRSFALIMEGSYSEALRELQSLQGRREIELCTTVAMIHAHKSAKIVDEEAVASLEERAAEEEDGAAERSLMHAATLYWHLGYSQKAFALTEKILRVKPDSSLALCLYSWIAITNSDEEEDKVVEVGKALEGFQRVLQNNDSSASTLEALLGQAKAYELLGQYRESLDVLNSVSTKYSWYLPVYNVKAKLQALTNDWDSVVETINFVLSRDETNVEALFTMCIQVISQQSQISAGRAIIERLLKAIKAREPRNASLYFRISRILSRLSAGDEGILKLTLEMIRSAREFGPMEATYAVEEGQQQLYMKAFDKAASCFNSAQSLDELNMGGLYGSIECMIEQGSFQEAAEQLEFMTEMVGIDEGGSALLTFLSTVVSWDRGADIAAVVKGLDKTFKEYTERLDRVLSLEDYYVELNPPFIARLTQQYLLLCGGNPRSSVEPRIPAIEKAKKVLDILMSATPGILSVQLLYARACYLDGDLESSAKVANGCIREDPAYIEPYILLAQIYLARNKIRMAQQVVEQAIGHNFAVREFPMYYLINAKALQEESKHKEALRVLESAMQLPGVRRADSSKRNSHMGEIGTSERVTIYLMLSEAYRRMDQLPESTKIIEDAMHEFKGTAEEVRVTIANCEIALSRGDAGAALEMLASVSPESPHYIRAKTALAQMHLTHRNNREMYSKCYEELVEQFPTVQTYCMMGDAMMQIQEPERAIKAFEMAYTLDRKDSSLASRLGRALITTHDYKRAVDYYEKAMNQSGPGAIHLQTELAELYIKLKRYDFATRTLENILTREKDDNDPSDLIIDVRALLLIADTCAKEGKSREGTAAKVEAKALQLKALNRMTHEQPEEVAKQSQLAAEICYMLGADCVAAKQIDNATEYFGEALKLNDGNVKSMLALAKIYFQKNELTKCQTQCVTLLRYDPENEEATIMLAEVMFQKELYETCIYHYQQLLERRPSHYSALSKLIQLMKRAGRLEEAPQQLSLAEKSVARASAAPGFHYCKGLYSKYCNNPREALKHFNMARNSGEWGVETVFQMVEIYLSPDNEAIWDVQGSEGGHEAVQVAKKLLNEVKSRSRDTVRYKVLEAYLLIASGEKALVEEAITRLLNLANEDTENVPVLLALAVGYNFLKQTPKARNQLKRIAKLPYNVEEAETFERSWLLLADMHVQSGKFDLAQEICVRCLRYNKSCAKAWEHMGAIMEREQAYANAAEHYENAWRYENEAISRVGYKLAFNLLKCKEYVRAVDICQKILEQDPDYPRVREDILEKAWANIRV